MSTRERLVPFSRPHFTSRHSDCQNPPIHLYDKHITRLAATPPAVSIVEPRGARLLANQKRTMKPKLLPTILLLFLITPNLFAADATTKPSILINEKDQPMQTGKFQPTWQSLQQYQVPDWYRNAKFGIWAHWGPQCEPEDGDWYARGMYQGRRVPKINITSPITGPPFPSSSFQGHHPPMESRKLGPAKTRRALQTRRRPILLRTRQPSRQFRSIRQHLPTLELHKARPAERPHRRLGTGRAR